MTVETNQAATGVNLGFTDETVNIEQLLDVSATTGTGTVVVLQETPTINTPVVDRLGSATPVVVAHEDTVIPSGSRAYQTLRSIRVNFADVPGTTVRLTGLARHYHDGTAQFTDGKVRLKIDGSTVYTSGTVGTGANNATGADLDSGLQTYTNPGSMVTVLIEVEAVVSGANKSRVVLADWNLVFK